MSEKQKVFIRIYRVHDLYAWSLISADEEERVEASCTTHLPTEGLAADVAQRTAQVNGWEVVDEEDYAIGEALDKLYDHLETKFKPAAGPWMRLEDAPWAKDGRGVLVDYKGVPRVASWHEQAEVWFIAGGIKHLESDPDRVAKINMEESKR